MGKDSSEPRISSTSSKERILTSRNGWILDQEGHYVGEAKVRANHKAKVVTLTKGRGNDMMSYDRGFTLPPRLDILVCHTFRFLFHKKILRKTLMKNEYRKTKNM